MRVLSSVTKPQFNPPHTDYYEHKWSLPHINDDIIEELPTELRSKLRMIINRDLVERNPSLQHMNIATYLHVAARLSHVTCLPGDFVATMTLRPGEFFGEHAMLHLTRLDVSFRAVEFLDLLAMSRAVFSELYIREVSWRRHLDVFSERWIYVDI